MKQEGFHPYRNFIKIKQAILRLQLMKQKNIKKKIKAITQKLEAMNLYEDGVLLLLLV
jgi:hypothetical protein